MPKRQDSPKVAEAKSRLKRIKCGENALAVYLQDRPGILNAKYYRLAIDQKIISDYQTIAEDVIKRELEEDATAQSEENVKQQN